MNPDLEKKREMIDQALGEALPPEVHFPSEFQRAARFAVLGPGKRLRPLLTLAAAEVFHMPASVALPGAIAMEFIHAASLILDDLPAMDNAALRRGRKAMHLEYSEGTALLVSHGLLALSFQCLLRGAEKARLSSEDLVRLIDHTAETVGFEGMCAGQYVDLTGTKGSPRVVEFVHDRKTARLFATSCYVGGLLAGAHELEERALIRFGESLGRAYQILDDLEDSEKDSRAALRLEGLKLKGRKEAQIKAQGYLGEARESVQPLGPGAQGLLDLLDLVG